MTIKTWWTKPDKHGAKTRIRKDSKGGKGFLRMWRDTKGVVHTRGRNYAPPKQ